MGSWRIGGPYFESCNCDPICPCRRIDFQAGGSVDLCQFGLAWTVSEGYFDDIALSGRQAVMVGYWDAEAPDWSWTVGVFVDAESTDAQREALAGILTGRFGGTPTHQYAAAISRVQFVQPADISIDHRAGRQKMEVRGRVSARARERYYTQSRISCGIPGHDRDGYELVMERLDVQTDGFEFSYRGNCGFAATYDYRSDPT